VNGPWNNISTLLIGFNSLNFPAIFTPTWQLSFALLVAGVIFYNFRGGGCTPTPSSSTSTSG